MPKNYASLSAMNLRAPIPATVCLIQILVRHEELKLRKINEY